MTFKKIEISGFRGFSVKQSLNLAVPIAKNGSGLTVIIGPNNSGKSTIYESFRALSQNSSHNQPSFTEGRRNKLAGDKIEITISDSDNHKLILKTNEAGGSETVFIEDGIKKQDVKFYTLPSRRTFSPFFSKGAYDRNTLILNSQLSAVRGSNFDHFSNRLFQIQKDQTKFNEIIKKVLSTTPKWNIEQSDSGQYYLKFDYNGSIHNSDGSGEGLLSVFTIVDTLYDSKENDLIFIDEPELSLHPAIQRKLLDLFLEYSSTRQIVISTHSPYFISWTAISNGGKIVRTVKETTGIKIYQLQDATAAEIVPLINNLNNPHILGLDAREIYFLDDNILLVEGQEDVIFLNRILELRSKTINGTFYGWGIGGCTNSGKILRMLSDLGFKRIAVILDNNVKDLIPPLQSQFQDYKFISIPANDIREKKAIPAKLPIEGLIDSEGKTLNPKYIDDIDKIITEINTYLK